MFSYLKALAARLRRQFGGFPPAPEDPFVGVREPRKRGPAGRSTAASVVEPAEMRSVNAHGAAHGTGHGAHRDR